MKTEEVFTRKIDGEEVEVIRIKVALEGSEKKDNLHKALLRAIEENIDSLSFLDTSHVISDILCSHLLLSVYQESLKAPVGM